MLLTGACMRMLEHWQWAHMHQHLSDHSTQRHRLFTVPVCCMFISSNMTSWTFPRANVNNESIDQGGSQHLSTSSPSMRLWSTVLLFQRFPSYGTNTDGVVDSLICQQVSQVCCSYGKHTTTHTHTAYVSSTVFMREQWRRLLSHTHIHSFIHKSTMTEPWGVPVPCLLFIHVCVVLMPVHELNASLWPLRIRFTRHWTRKCNSHVKWGFIHYGLRLFSWHSRWNTSSFSVGRNTFGWQHHLIP